MSSILNIKLKQLKTMKVEQIYTGCLAQGAYYIESNGEAAIIDPLREVQPYIAMAERNGAKIRYIFETHFHADFVSGHVDLAKKTGARIVYGPNASCGFDCLSAKDGQEFKLGEVTIVALHTPGHTMESTTFLLRDENGKDHAIFSGDTLFLGDVGRPDLAQKAASMTQEQLAGLLYDSLMTKIMPLADDVIVYPAHGAGSACGKNMMKETVDTLGNQKKMNYALNQPSKEAFVTAVLDGLTTPPGYFGFNVMMNKQGYDSIDTVMERGMKAMSATEFEQAADATEALVLDVRTPGEFAKSFIPRSINIGLKGDFAPWVGAMIVDVKQPLLLVCEPGQERECITRLARVGFDHVLGFLNGGFESWKAAGKEVDSVNRITAQQFESEFKAGITVVDVRKPSEYNAEHVEDAYSRPLDWINEWFGNLDADKTFYVHCAGGYRSMIAASILKSRGVHNFKEVDGGFNAIAKTTAVPRTDFICQSKVLK
jgi:glyoxylase-like metal-dependent hydrolase (beta-lactamase superfamily II)/rhodanese-related sulfurtransferase